MTNPRVYKGRLFYDGSYTDEFEWVKYYEVKHLLHHEPTADPTRCTEPGCGNMGMHGDGKCGYHSAENREASRE